MKKLTVSEISRRSPDMSDRDFDAFVEDIRTNGQLVPIWVRGDEVIDGRKRLAACERLGIEVKLINLDHSQDAEAVSRALNVLRTHYSPSQLTLYAAGRVNATSADGSSVRSITPSKNGRDGLVTARSAAAEVGVSVQSVKLAKSIIRKAVPEVTNKVKEGKLTLHAASQIAKLPKSEQPAAVEKVIEASKGKARHTPTAKVLTGEDPRRDRAVHRPRIEQLTRALDAMEVQADLIAQTIDAALDDVRRTQFADRLRAIRTLISQSISRMEKAA